MFVEVGQGPGIFLRSTIGSGVIGFTVHDIGVLVVKARGVDELLRCFVQAGVWQV